MMLGVYLRSGKHMEDTGCNLKNQPMTMVYAVLDALNS